jgi:hypothetical protein
MELPEGMDIPIPGYIESPGAGTGGLDELREKLAEVPEEVREEVREAIIGLEVPEESTPSLIIENGEFQRRVEVIMNAIHPDNLNAEENQRRLYAEVHTYLSLFDEGMRQSMLDMASMGGPFGMLKKMMSRG